jgi:hypothetical protein
MQMKTSRNKGFVLWLVIIAIGLIGAIMIVLTAGANTMMFQSDTAYLQAIECNLMASGSAWVRLNIRGKSPETFSRTVSLDLADMNMRGSSLTVGVGAPMDNRVEVQINTSCTRGRRTLDHVKKITLQLQ